MSQTTPRFPTMSDLAAYKEAAFALESALEDVHTAADARARALAHLHAQNRSYADLAALTGISRQQVARLVAHGRQLLGKPRLIRPRVQDNASVPTEPVDF